MDPTERELIVALELLRESITKLDQATLKNAQQNPATERGKKGDGGADLKSIFGGLAAKLSVIASVASIFQGLGPAFQLVGTAMKLLGTTLLPIVMPLFIGLAIALVMISDAIWENLEPALEEFYSFIYGVIIPALQAFGDAITWVIDSMKGAGEKIGDWISKKLYGDDEMAEQARKDALAGGATEAEANEIYNGLAASKKNFDWDESKQQSIADAAAKKAREEALAKGRTEAEADEAAKFAKFGGAMPKWMEEGQPPPAATPGLDYAGAVTGAVEGGAEKQGGASRLQRAMRDVFGELRNSIGPKASYTNIADITRNAQLAAMNESPIDAKILTMLTKSFEMQEIIAMNTAGTSGGRYPGKDGK